MNKDRMIRIGSHIDLKAVEARRLEERRAVDRALSLLETKFHSGEQAALLGRVFMGTDHKVITDENGRKKNVPLTIADVNSHMDELQREVEERTRQAVVDNTREAIEHQTSYFQQTTSPQAQERSQTRIEFVEAVIDHFLAQPLPNAGWTWSEIDPTYTRDEKVLTEFTDIIVPIGLRLMEGSEVERRMRREAISQRHSSTWMAILRKEGKLLKTYIDVATQERADTAKKAFDVANRLVSGQDAIYDDDTVAVMEAAAQRLQTLATDLSRLPSLDVVLPFFVSRISGVSSFRDILASKKKTAGE